MDSGIILLAEGNRRSADLFVEVLRINGIKNEVVVASNGIEALDFLFGTGDYAGRDITKMPRLIVLDVNMPRMTGLEALRRIRADERTKFLPVVVMSGTAFPEDVVEAYRLGANSYIDRMSNIPYPELVPHVARYWLELNEPPPLVGP